MIIHENGVFLLNNGSVSLLLRVNSHHLLEQLHFGAPVSLSDAAAFTYRSGLGWGGSVLLDDKDTGSCPDVMSLAWSGSGRGDYRESPLELTGKATDFRYTGYQILDGIAPMKQGLPQAKGEAETLEITMEQSGLRLKLYFTLFATAITRRTVLENTASGPVVIHKIMSSMMDLPGDYCMTTFDGSWIAEMRKHKVPVLDSRVVNESVTGFSSNRHNPGFLLSEPEATEDEGRVYGFNLVYSGNHYGAAQRSIQGLTRVVQGISPSNFAKELQPGACFETPEAVMTWSDQGFGGLSRQMHDFVNHHIVPQYWQGRPRPVLYNDWEGCMFDFNQRILLGLAKKAKELGCELFVLDDGWFGKRNDDKAGLGDYTVNKKKLPGGLKGLSDRIHAMGMEFGLWFEPESVNMDSDLYRAHPDWALTDEFVPILGRHQLLLDLTKPEVRDYIVENVTGILDNAGVSYVKWDMNRHSVALGAKAHDYILGLYDVLRRIFDPRPQVLLESCSSGGNRFDLGMLCYGPQVWCSDDTDPIERLTIQEGLSYLYPQSTFGAHVSASPHAQTLRATPLSTRGNVSFFGCLGYELDLNHLLPVEEKEIKTQTELYKKYRKVFQFGTFYRLKNGWQVSDGNTVLAGVFHGCSPAAPGWEYLRLKDLQRDTTYSFRSRPQALRVGQFGNLVKHVAPVELNPNGFILRTADKHITLPDGEHTGTASGSALTAGIPMLPAFRGTGYDANQRTQLDYGSNLYIIEG
ncbi:MAG: alpha-galactosidase [Oscillospiraceae bacterium]|nr:alpha-galactosidase [Oscillospiraceae bacterium]